MSDYQIVQHPVAQIHWLYNLSSLDEVQLAEEFAKNIAELTHE